MIWWLDSMVQIIKCFASLPDKPESYGSQRNKARIQDGQSRMSLLQLFRFLATEVYILTTIFFSLLSLGTRKQRDLSRILSAYASASCSEIHSVVPNIYQKTALRRKKKKPTALNLVPPSTGRHIKLNERKNIPIILYHEVKCNLSPAYEYVQKYSFAY